MILRSSFGKLAAYSIVAAVQQKTTPRRVSNQSSTTKKTPKTDAKGCVDRVQRWYTGEASCACRGTHPSKPWSQTVLQNHANHPPKQSSRIRSASTALHQGSDMLFQNQTTPCVNVSPALWFRRISGWDLHTTAILLPFSDTVSFFRTLGRPLTGLPSRVGAFDALRAHASLCVTCTLWVLCLIGVRYAQL